MADSTPLAKLDLAASAARVASARGFAEFQARLVEGAAGRIDDLNVDLLFLAQESVLVFEETHRLLAVFVAAKDVTSLAPPLQLFEQLRALKAARTSRFKKKLIVALSVVIALMLFVFLLEVVGPGRLKLVSADWSLG